VLFKYRRDKELQNAATLAVPLPLLVVLALRTEYKIYRTKSCSTKQLSLFTSQSVTSSRSQCNGTSNMQVHEVMKKMKGNLSHEIRTWNENTHHQMETLFKKRSHENSNRGKTVHYTYFENISTCFTLLSTSTFFFLHLLKIYPQTLKKPCSIRRRC
jgi:hypothetical protein